MGEGETQGRKMGGFKTLAKLRATRESPEEKATKKEHTNAATRKFCIGSGKNKRSGRSKSKVGGRRSIFNTFPASVPPGKERLYEEGGEGIG